MIVNAVKICQNKKGQIWPKNVSFSQLPAVKKDTIFGAAQTKLGSDWGSQIGQIFATIQCPSVVRRQQATHTNANSDCFTACLHANVSKTKVV